MLQSPHLQQIIWAGTALPHPNLPAQSNFGVCVEGNRIVAAGLHQELTDRYPDTPQRGGDHLLLMPALVNSHDHGRAIGTGSFGIADDLLEIWLLQLGAQPTIDPYLAAAFDGLLLLKSGVGTVSHSHNPRNWQTLETEAEQTIQGYRDVGIRVAFHPPIVDQNPIAYDPEAFRHHLPTKLRSLIEPTDVSSVVSTQDYFCLCRNLYNRFHDDQQHTVQIHVSPAGGQWCSDPLILEAVEFAQQHQTRVQMHLLETCYQRQYAYRRWGKSFIQHLDEIGVLGPWLTCAHMVWVDEADLALLAEREVGIAHNPSSNLRLRSGIAPVAAMHQAGINLGIGLDGHGLDDDQDYLREMRLAWTLGNQPRASSRNLEAQTIWQMGTVGGRRITLGKDIPLGCLAENELADLVLVDWEAVQGMWPLQAPNGLLRKATRQHIKHVMVNGDWVIWDGQSSQVNEVELIARLQEQLGQQNVAELEENARDSRSLARYLRSFYAKWDEQ